MSLGLKKSAFEFLNELLVSIAVDNPNSSLNERLTILKHDLDLKLSEIIFYTGKAWKHHLAEHFTSNKTPAKNNGAGAPSTIFLDKEKFLFEMEKAKSVGVYFWVCELELIDHPIILENNFRAICLATALSEKGFVSLEDFKKW